MGLYRLYVDIEANSRQEAEQKLLQMQKVLSEYRRVTLNDVLRSFIEACQAANKTMDAITLEKLTSAAAYEKATEILSKQTNEKHGL